MIKNLIGQLSIIKTMSLKPNYSELSGEQG